MNFLKYIFFLTLYLVPGLLYAQTNFDIFDLPDKQRFYLDTQNVYSYSGNLKIIDDIYKDKSNFKKFNSNNISKDNIHYVFYLRNVNTIDKEYFLSLSARNFTLKVRDSANNLIYDLKGGSGLPSYQLSDTSAIQTSSAVPFRISAHQILRFELHVERSYEPHVFLIQEQVARLNRLFEILNLRMNIGSFLQGIIWIILLVNIISYLMSKDKSYLYYSAYLLFASIYFAGRSYLLHHYLIGDFRYVYSYIWVGSIIGTMVFYFLFMRSFLEIKKLSAHLNKVILYWCALSLFFLIGMFISLNIDDNLIDITLLGVPLALVSFAIGAYILVRIRNKIHSAGKYFILGTSFLLFFTIIYAIIFALNRYGFTNFNIANQVNWVSFGVFLEIICFSLGMSKRIENSRKEKIAFQTKLIEQLQRNKNMQAEMNKELEEKVKFRTAQLVERNEEVLRQSEAIVAQAQLIEEKTRDIMDSIHYAKNIQKAMLPSVNAIKREFDDMFIFLKPKDIVSGDFYFFAKSKGKIFLAAVDCTGHGVPGAFMSMLGTDALTNIVIQNHVHDSNVILNELHKFVRQALKQKEGTNRDGMDISLITHDIANKVVNFSGAKNPLFYVNSKGSQLIKGDRFSIGGEQSEFERCFKKHSIFLEEEHTFYLYTDGFQDQFGGEKNKKFMAKRLRKILFQHHALAMKNQMEQLVTELDNWQGNEEQVDDILVIGVRVKAGT